MPGDAKASALPAAVFEVHLKNEIDQRQTGKIAFNFPGPRSSEAGAATFSRSEKQDGSRKAMLVEAGRTQYSVAVLEAAAVEFGGNLSKGGTAWSEIDQHLPPVTEQDAGTSAAVAFDLAPGESRTVRFVLACGLEQAMTAW